MAEVLKINTILYSTYFDTKWYIYFCMRIISVVGLNDCFVARNLRLLYSEEPLSHSSLTSSVLRSDYDDELPTMNYHGLSKMGRIYTADRQ